MGGQCRGVYGVCGWNARLVAVACICVCVCVHKYRYEGEWAFDCMHGHGALVGADGSRYEGLLIKGEIAGQVFFIFYFIFGR